MWAQPIVCSSFSPTGMIHHNAARGRTAPFGRLRWTTVVDTKPGHGAARRLRFERVGDLRVE